MTTLSGIALECPDPEALAAFYAALLETPVVHSGPDWCSIEAAGLHLSFQRAPGHRPPAWPDPASSTCDLPSPGPSTTAPAKRASGS